MGPKALKIACVGGGISSLIVVFFPRIALLQMVKDKKSLENRRDDQTKISEELMRWVAILCFYVCGSGYWISGKSHDQTKEIRMILGITLILDSFLVKHLGFCRANVFSTLHSRGHVYIDGVMGSLLLLSAA
jgi:hypothetical protein